jgi:glycerol-3-phosphate acyltransferase PlsX
MAATVTTSLDVMGGDEGPGMVIPGAEIALIRRPDLRFRLFGDQKAVLPLLDRHPRVREASVFEHTDIAVKMDEKPSQALRHGRWRSSMWRCIESVKRHEADFAVSAGNTGALMAMSKFCLKTIPGIDRPAIAALWPNLRGESVVLDVGASIGADARDLYDFALMGGAMARAVFDVERPTVGLLNIGVEEVKGLEPIKAAGQMLKDAGLTTLEYVGFVEGDDIGKGTVEVVVTEGFSGNIALKTAEGTAKQIGGYLRAAMGRTIFARIGYFLARDAFDQLRMKMDPRRVNGGVFLGLNGIVIKSHGGTDAEGFASAIELGHSMVRNELLAKINLDLAVKEPPPQPASVAALMANTGAL